MARAPSLRVQGTRIPHHQQPIPLHNTNTPQVSLHNNATSSRKLLKMDVLTSETYWAVNWHNKASVIKLVYLYSIIYLYLIFISSTKGMAHLKEDSWLLDPWWWLHYEPSKYHKPLTQWHDASPQRHESPRTSTITQCTFLTQTNFSVQVPWQTFVLGTFVSPHQYNEKLDNVCMTQ